MVPMKNEREGRHHESNYDEEDSNTQDDVTPTSDSRLEDGIIGVLRVVINRHFLSNRVGRGYLVGAAAAVVAVFAKFNGVAFEAAIVGGIKVGNFGLVGNVPFAVRASLDAGGGDGARSLRPGCTGFGVAQNGP